MNHQSARAAAMQTLLDCKIDKLPVDLNAICKRLGVNVLSYDESAELIERAHLYRVVRRTSGLAFYLRDDPVILFDELRNFPEVMFTVAHELGHIVLGHVTPGGTTRGEVADKMKVEQEEKAADRFAVHLLAPACVLMGLNIHTAQEIVKLCRIPEPAAKYRAGRMAWLSMQKVFLLDPMEMAVCRQFQPYIREKEYYKPRKEAAQA